MWCIAVTPYMTIEVYSERKPSWPHQHMVLSSWTSPHPPKRVRPFSKPHTGFGGCRRGLGNGGKKGDARRGGDEQEGAARGGLEGGDGCERDSCLYKGRTVPVSWASFLVPSSLFPSDIISTF